MVLFSTKTNTTENKGFTTSYLISSFSCILVLEETAESLEGFLFFVVVFFYIICFLKEINALFCLLENKCRNDSM